MSKNNFNQDESQREADENQNSFMNSIIPTSLAKISENQNCETKPSIIVGNQDQGHRSMPDIPRSTLREESKIMKLCKKAGPKILPATTYVRRMNNMPKWDAKLLMYQLDKKEDLYIQNNLELSIQSKQVLSKYDMRKFQTQDLKAILTDSSPKKIHLSYFNCKLLHKILQQQGPNKIFSNNRLANKKSYYVHIFNRFLRLQNLQISKRTQAR